MLNWFVQLFTTIAAIFDAIYSIVNGWIWPFNQVAFLFKWVRDNFQAVASAFASFSTWLESLWAIIQTLISWDNLRSWFFPYLDILITVWNWVGNAVSNIWNVITNWWSATATTVQSWIAAAVQGFQGMVALWNYFWNSILPNLMTVAQWYLLWPLKLMEITGLIDSSFLTREGFWKGWQEVRDNVVGFITAPLDFLLDKFTDWFLGKGE